MIKLEFRLIESTELDEEEIRIFEGLLTEQGQVDTSKGKARRCHRLCIARLDSKPVGIGALKEVYKAPFKYAGVEEIGDEYKYELGYLYVKEDAKGFGIGKYVSKILVHSEEGENIFATTEPNQGNAMCHILKSLGFISIGVSYLGRSTGKQLSLMVLNRKP